MFWENIEILSKFLTELKSEVWWVCRCWWASSSDRSDYVWWSRKRFPSSKLNRLKRIFLGQKFGSYTRSWRFGSTPIINYWLFVQKLSEGSFFNWLFCEFVRFCRYFCTFSAVNWTETLVKNSQFFFQKLFPLNSLSPSPLPTLCIYGFRLFFLLQFLYVSFRSLLDLLFRHIFIVFEFWEF